MTAQRLAPAALAAAAFLILGFSVVGGPAASAGFAVVAALVPFVLMALGAARRGRLGAAAVPILLAAAFVEAAIVGMLLLRGRVLDGPWAGGLPLAAALQIYGLFLLPLAIVSLGFALAFRDFDVDAQELERLRELAVEEGEE